MDGPLMERITDKLLDLQGEENHDLKLLESRLADTEKGISNMLDAIQAGIITASTKQRLAELEAEKEELEQQIIENRIQHPVLSREQISFFLDQFKRTDVTDKEQRQRLIDSFVNAVYVYEDKIVFTFNYKGGAKTISLDDIQGSDLDAECPPKEGLYEPIGLYRPSFSHFIASFIICQLISGAADGISQLTTPSLLWAITLSWTFMRTKSLG